MEGYARTHNPPTGTYGMPLAGERVLVSEDEVLLPPPYRAGDVADRLVVETGGYRIRPGVYWYEKDFWTFQSGARLEERYVNAVEFARRWDERFSKITGEKAVVKVLWGDHTVAVLTKPLSNEMVSTLEAEASRTAITDTAAVDPVEVASDEQTTSKAEVVQAEIHNAPSPAPISEPAQGSAPSPESAVPFVLPGEQILEAEAATGSGARMAFWL